MTFATIYNLVDVELTPQFYNNEALLKNLPLEANLELSGLMGGFVMHLLSIDSPDFNRA